MGLKERRRSSYSTSSDEIDNFGQNFGLNKNHGSILTGSASLTAVGTNQNKTQ